MSQRNDNAASRLLAEHVANLRFETLQPEVVHAFKRVLLDYLTCAVTGSQMPVSRTLRTYLAEIDATSQACVIGTAMRLSPPNAAFANGASTHGLDFDDGYTAGSAHPAGPTFPAVLALAEARGANARSIVTAVVLAYDVMLRIAAALHPVSARRGFHNTPVAGIFGAAAGSASLLGLDSRHTLDALGLAGSFAGGLREYLDEGAEIKRIHPGKAARDGVICAELAKRGLSGPSRILEGRHGLFRAFADSSVNWDRLLDGLGSKFAITDAYFKPYPCCRHFHAAIDGIMQLKAQHAVDPAAIERVDIGMYEVGYTGHEHSHCDNLLDAQMSAPVACALALICPDLTMQSFGAEQFERPDFKALIGKMHPYVDSECERIYPGRRSGMVSIHLKSGADLRARVLDPRGEGENPLSDAELERKFVANCEPVIGDARCRRLVAAVWNFEELSGLAEFYRWS
jgi:2-methylcitrate dehydratase PrpD